MKTVELWTRSEGTDSLNPFRWMVYRGVRNCLWFSEEDEARAEYQHALDEVTAEREDASGGDGNRRERAEPEEELGSDRADTRSRSLPSHPRRGR